MDSKIENVVVKGICSYVPKNFEDNMDFVSLLGERRVKKQIKLTGIRKRHTSVKFQSPSDLATFAAEKLICELGWDKGEIGVLILVTQGGDYIIPSTAIRLQERLGLPKECVAFDINLGCSAFNYGVHTAASILANSMDYKKGLCLVADAVGGLVTARTFNKESISFGMLAGSAASAVALEREQGTSIISYSSCDGSNYDAIIKTSFWRDTMMKGNVVFEYAINDVSQYILDFKEKHSLSEEAIDYYVFHQAQKLIVDSIVSACDLSPDKVLYSLEEYGNTSGASIPLTLNANAELLKKKENVRLLLCGFGVGLSCGITYLEIKTDHITNVEETDELFDVEQLPKWRLHDLNIMVFDADRVIGEFLSEILDESDASLILCGHDKTKLEMIQQKLHRDSTILPYKDESDFAEKLEQIHDKPIDGIVNIDDTKIAEWLSHQDFFKEELSVVLLDGEDHIERLREYEAIFRERIENIRINMVCYKKESMDFYPWQPGEQSWAHKFLEEDLPSDMIRTNYLYNSIEFLLYKTSRFVSGSVIRISDQIQWF